MDTEQPTGSEPSVQSRMADFFGSPEPEVAPEPEAPVAVATEEPPAEEQAEDGLEELDLDGEVFKVPPTLKAKVSEWKEGYLRREDYTQKTQEAADLRRQAQIAAEALQTRQAFDHEIASERTELNRVQADIERYKAVDWSSLDVDNYIKLRGQFDTLKEKAAELNGKINEKAQQLTSKLNEQKRQLIENGHKFLQKSIKDWGPEAQKAANSGAKNVGYTDSELENVYDARFAVLSWKAAQYDKLKSGTAEAVKKAQTAPPVVKPGVKGTPQASKENALRQQLKSKGDLQSAAALLASRMR